MIARQSGCVAIGDRAILIEGEPGTGKSMLALALIDRGAELIGDDSVSLEAADGRLIARPHSNTRGLIEVRNLGLLSFPVREVVEIALVIRLIDGAPRYIEAADTTEIAGVILPLVQLSPGGSDLALKAELALSHYGLSLG